MKKIILFLGSLQEAVQAGKQEFTCPICGGTVKWDEASGNGHIHASCDGCGIRCAE